MEEFQGTMSEKRDQLEKLKVNTLYCIVLSLYNLIIFLASFEQNIVFSSIIFNSK